LLTFETGRQRLLIDFNPTLKLLPPELSNASALNYIGCEGNELLSPGMEVLAKGVKPVVSYLKCLREVPLGIDQRQICCHFRSYLPLT
jgi:Leucine-rich repeat (LRR) protein